VRAADANEDEQAGEANGEVHGRPEQEACRRSRSGFQRAAADLEAADCPLDRRRVLMPAVLPYYCALSVRCRVASRGALNLFHVAARHGLRRAAAAHRHGRYGGLC
jgi:hypothetical protein